jgi:hypothetical protein
MKPHTNPLMMEMKMICGHLMTKVLVLLALSAGIIVIVVVIVVAIASQFGGATMRWDRMRVAAATLDAMGMHHRHGYISSLGVFC